MSKWPIILALFAVVAQTFIETSHSLRASASDSLVASGKAVIEAKLLEPLQKKEAERPRFSRAILPPHARRIRILGNTPYTDAKGRPYLPFAIDESRAYGVKSDKEMTEADWLKDVITGCVYPETEVVMVKRGEAYYASSILLGLQTPIAPADVCRAR